MDDRFNRRVLVYPAAVLAVTSCFWSREDNKFKTETDYSDSLVMEARKNYDKSNLERMAMDVVSSKRTGEVLGLRVNLTEKQQKNIAQYPSLILEITGTGIYLKDLRSNDKGEIYAKFPRKIRLEELENATFRINGDNGRPLYEGKFDIPRDAKL